MIVTIDPARMRVAVPAVRALTEVLEDADRSLAGVDTGGLPAAAGADVTACVSSARAALRGSLRSLAGIPDDLLRRVSAAQVKETPWMAALSGFLRASGMFAGSFTMQALSRTASAAWAARMVASGVRAGGRYGGGPLTAWRLTNAAARDAFGRPPRGLPKGLSRGAQVAGKGVSVAGWGLTAYTNFRNPYLSTSQKIGRTGASIATGTTVSVLSAAAAGATFGSAAGPAGFLIGAGAGIAWSVVDQKLNVSNHIGDAAATAIDAGADAASAVGGAAADAASAVGGVASDGAKAVAGAAGDVTDALGF